LTFLTNTRKKPKSGVTELIEALLTLMMASWKNTLAVKKSA
jgi:hypothetical protein